MSNDACEVLAWDLGQALGTYMDDEGIIFPTTYLKYPGGWVADPAKDELFGTPLPGGRLTPEQTSTFATLLITEPLSQQRASDEPGRLVSP